MIASEQESLTKAQILARLTAAGEEFENWVKTLPEDFLAQAVTMPPGGNSAVAHALRHADCGEGA